MHLGHPEVVLLCRRRYETVSLPPGCGGARGGGNLPNGNEPEGENLAACRGESCQLPAPAPRGGTQAFVLLLLLLLLLLPMLLLGDPPGGRAVALGVSSAE